MHIQATNVKIDDDMNVFLVVSFESTRGDRIDLQRAFRFDSDHECVGPVNLWHHRGAWPAPDCVEWGGQDALERVELQRRKVVLTLSDQIAPHPERVTVFEVEFDLPEAQFEPLRRAMSRCFREYDWYADHAAAVPSSDSVERPCQGTPMLADQGKCQAR